MVVSFVVDVDVVGDAVVGVVNESELALSLKIGAISVVAAILCYNH